MTVNVKMDLIDLSSVVDTIAYALNGGSYVSSSEGIIKDEVTREYHSMLCGALRAYRDALEEEVLRYDDGSYDAYQINHVIMKIGKVLLEQGAR